MNETSKSGIRRPNRRWRLLPLVATLGATVAGMGNSPAGAAGQAVPFTFSVSGSFSGIDATHISLTGTGIASHMGNVKTYGAVVTITSGNIGDPVLTDTLTETLTAANGDTITLTCSQTATLSSGVYHGSDVWTVAGGTGRFSDATGSGVGDTYADLNGGTFTKQETGSITY